MDMSDDWQIKVSLIHQHAGKRFKARAVEIQADV